MRKSELLGHTNLNTTKKYLYSLKERREKAVSILDKIDNISTGQGISHEGQNVSHCNLKWRCRDLNPGLCEYESHALPTELHRLSS